MNAHAPVKFLVCVDDTDHARVALRFAALRAQRRQGRLDVLHILEPSDYQGLKSVAGKMREEKRREGTMLLQRMAEQIQEEYGLIPCLILREGVLQEEIITATEEDVDANMLILGASPDGDGRTELIAAVAKQLGRRVQVPMIVVPGNLTDQQIEALG